MKRCVAHFFLFFAGLCSLMAQHPMRYIEGIPYIFNYHSGDYQAEQQNWSVVEDKKGVVYFANGAGVLEFDGSGWRLIRLPNRAGVYSLAMDEEGKIFVGGNNELGYLAADYLGNLHYASLLSKIAPEARNFEEVTHIFTKDEKVFFLTRFTLFVYDRYTISPLKAYTEFVNGFLLDNQLYVQEKKKGLKKWDGEKLIDFYTPSEFLNDPIIAMLPFEKDAYLLITSAQKSYLFRNNTFSPTTFMMQAAIQSGNITTVKVLSNGFYALGTLKKGIFILNRHGRIVYHINKSSGLENDYITYLHEDTHGNLWASLGNGLSYIELNAPFSRINEVNGLLGIPKTACFYRQTLYVGTTQGIFYKPWLPYQDETFTLTQFQFLENSDVRMWHIARIGDELFGLHQNGILLIEGKKATRLYEGEPVWTIVRLQEHADKLLAGTSDGLIVLEKKEKKWQFSHRVQGFSEKINFLLQDSEGNLWISHEAKGLYKLTLSSNLKLIKSMSRYGSHHGLPSMYGNRIFIVHGLLAVGTEKGVYVYQSRNNRFVSYEKINQYLKGLPSIKWLVEEPSGDIWYQAGEVGEYSTKTLSDIGLLRKKADQTYQLERLPFYKLRGVGIQDITPIDSNHVLFETTNGIIQYTKLIDKNYQKSFNTLIRSMEILGSDQEPVFTGVVAGKEQYEYVLKKPQAKLIIPYQQNSVRFSVGATFYESPEAVQYQYFLEGLDEKWTEWTTTTYKEYTNLKEGDYVFHVKAKNIYEVVSEETLYAFKVSTPLYRTHVAYMFYLLIASAVVYGIVKLNTYYLKAKNKRLEKIIQDRTKEIQEKTTLLISRNREVNDAKFKLRKAHEELKAINENLEQMVNERTEKLKKANEELDTFVYRASHDLKGPLMRLLGLAQLALIETQEPVARGYLQWIEKNIQEMDSTLDKLLMVNVINRSSNKKELINFEELKKYLLDYVYRHFPQAQHVEIRFHIEENISFVSDEGLLRMITENLLENAILYYNKNEEKPFVAITIRLEQEKLHIRVEDNGIGIRQEYLPMIYDMFFRGTELSKGNGLGLYVVRKALEKLNGKIVCQSELGKYTIFDVWIPSLKY